MLILNVFSFLGWVCIEIIDGNSYARLLDSEMY